MKTIPISRPGAGPEPTVSADAQAAAQRRANAIAKLEGKSQPQNDPNPIPTNANNVSVEELSSVHAKAQPELQAEEQQVTTEEVREVSKPKVEQEAELSKSQMAILARKERALRAKAQQQQQEIQAKESQWAQEKQALEARLQELETGYIPKSQIKQAAFEALQRGELSYDEITAEVMNPMDQRVASTISRLEKQVSDLTSKLENAGKQAQDAQAQQYQAALKQIKTDVTQLVKTDPTFEMIKATGSVQDVVDLIEQTYKEEGYVMTVEEAAQEVEEYLVEETSKLAQVEKIKKRFATASAVKKADETSQTQTPNTNKQSQQMKTLTNANTGSRKLSARERAILAFKGETKS